MPEDKMAASSRIGGEDPVSIWELIAEYAKHMEHRLKQKNGIAD